MKKILLVDDEKDIGLLLSSLLTHHGYEIEIAYDGVEALNKIASAYSNHQSYDLILLDILMPEMDGKEVLEHIRDEEKNCGITEQKGIPVIMLTANPQQLVPSYQIGCNGFVSKPFDHKDLIQEIEKVLS